MGKETGKTSTSSSSSTSSKTLFVRNLPFTTSDAELSSAFEKYGKIKSCFTVKDKGVVEKCRGFGYIIFENSECAEKGKVGVKKVKGRPVQVVFSNKRNPKLERRENGAERKPEVEEGEKVEEEDRGGGEEDEEEEDEGGGHAGEPTEMSSESSEDEGSDYEAMTARGGDLKLQKPHKPRSQRAEPKFLVGKVVVVTGIPPDTHKTKLKKKCAKFGPLEELSYPIATGNDASGEREASAHVTYKNCKDARKAVKALKGLKFGDLLNPLEAVLMSREGKVVSKKTLMKSRLIIRNLNFQCHNKDLEKVFSRYGDVVEVHIPRKPNGHMLGYGFIQFSSYFDAEKALKGVNGTEIKGRLVAVDWVVAKHVYEGSMVRKDHQEEEETEEKIEEEEDSEAEDEEEEVEEEEEDSKEEEEDSEEEEEGEEECSETESEAKPPPKKKFESDAHEGKTAFVKNLPLDAEEGELKSLFSLFGRVRYARIVMDHTTGLNRGSGFVQFLHPPSLQKCLESTSSGEQPLIYNGRQLDVSLALSPEELENMRTREKKEKEDRRNIYLAKEGTILPGSEAAQDLLKSDLAKRAKAQVEKKAKLANPNFHVSRTRLSIRNIPTQVSEKRLKEIFQNASGGGQIKQLKTLRSSTRVDADGIGRSKGFGFVEFTTHETALTALRATNNNPSIFGTKKRLIVEFAVEDTRIVKSREQKKQRQRERAIRGRKEEDEGEGEGGGRGGVGEGGRRGKGGGRGKGERGGGGRGGGEQGGEETNAKKLSKKVEWILKRKERRKNKIEQNKNEEEKMATGEERKENGRRGGGGRGGGRGGGGGGDVQASVDTNRHTESYQRGKMREVEEEGKEREHRGGSGVIRKGVGRGGGVVRGGANSSSAGAGTRLGRKAEKRSRREEDRDEEAFAKMVDSYRRKLFANS